jgi:hypothetical protein
MQEETDDYHDAEVRGRIQSNSLREGHGGGGSSEESGHKGNKVYWGAAVAQGKSGVKTKLKILGLYPARATF